LLTDRVMAAKHGLLRTTIANAEPPPFEHCPRCRKAWEMFPVYRCPSCHLTFCAACELENPGSRDKRWLISAAAESDVKRCPACTEPITESDKIGVIAGRH
jgi:hypothetical protein